MKHLSKLGLALLLLGIAFACKQAEVDGAAEASGDLTAADTTAVTTTSSNAAVENKESNRKFVRTADLKFKVKNVPQSTYAIENALQSPNKSILLIQVLDAIETNSRWFLFYNTEMFDNFNGHFDTIARKDIFKNRG